MPDYNMYDKIVAETLTTLMEVAYNNDGLAINNFLELEHIKYFIEIGKMACDLTQKQLYVRMKFFPFYKYKLHNWKMMKGIKRQTSKSKVKSANIPLLMDRILSEYNLEHKEIFVDIYKEYYAIK